MPTIDEQLLSLGVITDIGPVRDHVAPVAIEIAELWPLRFIWGAPGRGTGDHAVGLALDFMTYGGGTVNAPTNPRHWVGDEIAAYVLANRHRLNAEYVIWNRRIASANSNPPWSWREYDGTNPHTDHPHVSFEPIGTYAPPEDDVTPAEMETIAQRAATLVLAGVGAKVWSHKLNNPVPDGFDAAAEVWVTHGRVNIDDTERLATAINLDVDGLTELVTELAARIPPAASTPEVSSEDS